MSNISNSTTSSALPASVDLTSDDAWRIACRVLGLASCTLTILVLAHPKLSDKTYKFLLVISVADFVYLALSLLNFTLKLTCSFSVEQTPCQYVLGL